MVNIERFFVCEILFQHSVQYNTVVDITPITLRLLFALVVTLHIVMDFLKILGDRDTVSWR